MKDKKALDNSMEIYKINDVVLSREQQNTMFYGVVVDVNSKEGKVYVDWGGVTKQEDPNDLMLWPYADTDFIRERLQARKIASDILKLANDLLEEGE